MKSAPAAEKGSPGFPAIRVPEFDINARKDRKEVDKVNWTCVATWFFLCSVYGPLVIH